MQISYKFSLYRADKVLKMLMSTWVDSQADAPTAVATAKNHLRVFASILKQHYQIYLYFIIYFIVHPVRQWFQRHQRLILAVMWDKVFTTK